MSDFKIGADPELFLKRRDGSLVSAHDLVPGTKKAPRKVKSGAVQPDGLAAEFNIEAVDYSDFRAFDSNLTEVLGELKAIVGDDVLFGREASVNFDQTYYEGLPDTAKELGCDPDFCAYSDDPRQPNPRPESTNGLRSAAGHIHVGWGDDIPVDHPEHVEICRSFVKQLDLYVGLGMTIFDSDGERRKLYGKAGAYRPKSYGVEYRTPSNAWIFSRTRRQFIHNLVVSAINNMKSGNPSYQLFENTSTGYRKIYGDPATAINTGDAKTARKILTDVLGISVPANL